MKYIILLFLSSCLIHAQNVAEHFKTRRFEVAIFPESSNELMQQNRFTPTKEEIIKAVLFYSFECVGTQFSFASAGEVLVLVD